MPAIAMLLIVTKNGQLFAAFEEVGDNAIHAFKHTLKLWDLADVLIQQLKPMIITAHHESSHPIGILLKYVPHGSHLIFGISCQRIELIRASMRSFQSHSIYSSRFLCSAMFET